ncbi:MAG TPA: hypothetical protein VEA69_05400 [Tepidisphaeraceae bacterium]|nr:hypothetical protein [Tepidisphaeraceae bacterium]
MSTDPNASINTLLVDGHTKYLRKVPKALAAYLTGRPLVLEPERTALAQRWFFFGAGGVGLSAPVVPPGYRFEQFGFPEKAFADVAGLRFDDADDRASAVMYPMQSWAMYRVEFGWARAALEGLYPISKSGIGVVTDDGRAGVVVRRFAGNLPADPNPSKLHFEVAAWGHAGGGAQSDAV